MEKGDIEPSGAPTTLNWLSLSISLYVLFNVSAKMLPRQINGQHNIFPLLITAYKLLLPFYGHYTGQPASAGSPS